MLHPDKTRLIEFGRFAAAQREKRGLRQTGNLQLPWLYLHLRTSRVKVTSCSKRKTRRDRMRAKLKEVKGELRQRMHQSIPEQGRWLKQVVTGYFAYHAVPTNSRALQTFRNHIVDLWRRTLRRRSQTDRMTWRRISKLADDFLPKPRILHPWPSDRFAGRSLRWEPSA